MYLVIFLDFKFISHSAKNNNSQYFNAILFAYTFYFITEYLKYFDDSFTSTIYYTKNLTYYYTYIPKILT